MENYEIRCGSIDIPDDWKELDDSDCSLLYATTIYRNEYQCIQLMKQYQDFKTLFKHTEPKKYANIHKRAYLSFQIQFQSECLEKIEELREIAKLSRVMYPCLFIASPNG
jgi:hypothetical protein